MTIHHGSPAGDFAAALEGMSGHNTLSLVATVIMLD